MPMLASTYVLGGKPRTVKKQLSVRLKKNPGKYVAFTSNERGLTRERKI